MQVRRDGSFRTGRKRDMPQVLIELWIYQAIRLDISGALLFRELIRVSPASSMYWFNAVSMA